MFCFGVVFEGKIDVLFGDFLIMVKKYCLQICLEFVKVCFDQSMTRSNATKEKRMCSVGV